MTDYGNIDEFIASDAFWSGVVDEEKPIDMTADSACMPQKYHPMLVFAVMAYKKGIIDGEKYTEMYNGLLEIGEINPNGTIAYR